MDYVKSCKPCQGNRPFPSYESEGRLPLTNLFDSFSVDFAGPLPTTTTGNRFLPSGVEHLTGWSIVTPSRTSAAKVVLQFIENEIIQHFGLPRTIVPDSATAFMTKAIQNYMKDMGISWTSVLAYAPMSNGRAERIVDTMNKV